MFASPQGYCATDANQVWSWDITWLPAPVRGMFFYLYMIMDVYSRKIVGWEVHRVESADLSATLLHKAILSEGCLLDPPVLHADNGSPQKGFTMKAKMQALGVTPSYSRPRVSNDNPYSEALFAHSNITRSIHLGASKTSTRPDIGSAASLPGTTKNTFIAQFGMLGLHSAMREKISGSLPSVIGFTSRPGNAGMIGGAAQHATGNRSKPFWLNVPKTSETKAPVLCEAA